MINAQKNLLIQTVNAAKWNYIGSFAQLTFQFAIGIILARILGPEPFGLVAMAWIIIGIGKLIGDFGISAFLIQNPNLTDDEIGFAFTIQILIGTTLTIIGYFSAELISSFYQQKNSSDIIKALSLTFLTQSIGQTTTAKLNRNLKFKFIQIINITTYIIGYIFIALPLAYYQYGVWSLVGGQLSQSIFYTIFILSFSDVSIKPKFNISQSNFIKFGTKVMLANITSWCILNLDSLIIGRSLGATALGLYSRTLIIVSAPMNAVTSGLQAVIFSSTSKIQDNHDRVALTLLAATELLAFICFPIFLTIAIIPETVVLGVYGYKWKEAIPLLTPLSLAMPVSALLAVIGPVLMAINKTEKEFKSQIVVILVMIPCLIFTSQFSLIYVAWSILGIYLLRWILLLLSICQSLSITMTKVAKTLTLPLLISSINSIVIFILDRHIIIQNHSIKLIIIITISIFLIAVTFRTLGKRILGGPIGLLIDNRNIIPISLTWWLRLKV